MDALMSEDASADWSGEVNTTAGVITSATPVEHLEQLGAPVTVLTFFLGTIYALIILVSFVGNLMVVVVILSTHKLKTTTNYLLMALAVADLTVTVLVLPYALVYDISGTWPFGSTFCRFWMSWDVTACTASLQHLCAVAVDRYFAINDPLHYYERMSSRKVIVIVAVIWLNSSCISFLPIFLDWYSDNSESTNVMNGQCFLDINKPYAVISASISFYIPLAIMGGCYYKIFSIAMKQAKEIYRMQKSLQHNNPDDTQSLTNKSNNLASERKAIRTLGIIFGMFYLCWQPFFIIYWIYAFSAHPDIPNWVRSSITWLGYINSAMNPAIYALNPDFRAAYKKIAWMLIKKCPGGLALKDRHNSLYGAPYDQRNSSPLTIPDLDANEPPRDRDRPSPHTMRNYSSIGVTEIARITYVNGHHPPESLSLYKSPLQPTVSTLP